MEKSVYFLGLLLVSIFTSCEKDLVNDNNNKIDPEDIILEIYSVCYGDNPDNYYRVSPMPMNYYLDYYTTLSMDEEGELAINFESQDVEQYVMYASRKGYYTEIYNFRNHDTLWIDLDTIKTGMACGVLMMNSHCMLPDYIYNTEVTLFKDGNQVSTITTDTMGRFYTSPMPGIYQIEFPAGNFNNISLSLLYQDIIINDESNCWYDTTIVRKPNIYLYPEKTIKLDVELDFPMGGSIVASIPEYNTGWLNITVEPDGKIDNKYDFLFYESKNPDIYQRNMGWVIEKEKLGNFFRSNMESTGFNEREINDFIEYWIPRLAESPWYAVYPQYNEIIDQVIQIKISEEPESKIRLFYIMKGLDSGGLILKEPEIPSFSRKGFTLTEWGVIIDN